MRDVLVILGCLFLLSACVSDGHAAAEAPVAEVPTVCSIRANPSRYAGREITIRAANVTDYFEFSSLADRSCPRTFLALAGGSPDVARNRLERAHCSERLAQGDLVELTVRGVVQYDPSEAISTRFLILDVSDVGYAPSGALAAQERRDPRSRAWLCPNLREPSQ
ncbi:MAG: hypothetical protein K2P70_11020 [Hyphomonadaceae bacterium]|nr:hypothetical protein [Hyphomonadaceae bacterium]